MTPRSSPSFSMREPRRSWRVAVRWGVIAAIALAVLGVVTFVALWFYANAKIDQITLPAFEENATDPDAPVDVIEGTLNVLVVGNATREGLTEEQLLELGTEDDGSSVTDTVMLVQISPVREEAVVVSFPRDLRVDPPGDAPVMKINAVIANGGPDLLVRTVQDLTGVRLDHYVEIDMAGFLDLASALGGVEVCLDEALVDVYAGVDLPAGCQDLDGIDALGFVRSRRVATEQFGADDFGRIAKQQYFIRQAMSKVSTAGTLLNPLKVKRLIDAVAGAVTTDRALGLREMWRIANTLENFDTDSVVMRTVPGYAAEENGISYVFAYPEQAETLFQRLRDGGDVATVGTEQPAELAPGDVSVLVVNGVGREGLAARVSDELGAAGFVVLDAVNPQDLDPAATWDPALTAVTLYHSAGNRVMADLFVASFEDRTIQLAEVEPTELPEGADLLLEVGSDWEPAATEDPSASESPSDAASG